MWGIVQLGFDCRLPSPWPHRYRRPLLAIQQTHVMGIGKQQASPPRPAQAAHGGQRWETPSMNSRAALVFLVFRTNDVSKAQGLCWAVGFEFGALKQNMLTACGRRASRRLESRLCHGLMDGCARVFFLVQHLRAPRPGSQVPARGGGHCLVRGRW